MATRARYCSKCGAGIETREVEGRMREVCSRCNTVFYQNPLPVASSLVLNERREALLVKRGKEPQKGLWCLPIGFAELGETIKQAALRELTEETGITGRVLRLLDTDSHSSDFYGDLLIVTFEVVRMGGREKPGDDAEEVRYFPVDEVPPLAFAANEKALRTCVALHEEEWAIQDSFSNLHAQEGGVLLSDPLLAFVEENAEEIAQSWLADIRSNHTTAAYRDVDDEALFERGEAAILLFSRWLREEEADETARTFFRTIGRERRRAGIPLHQLLSSLTLLRKHIWTYALNHGVGERLIDVYRGLEMDRRIILFFDRAMYRITKGYEEDPGS